MRRKNYLLKSLFIVPLLLLLSCKGGGEEEAKANPYNLEMISTLEEYNQSVANDSTHLLVNLEEYIPGIVLDIRYATEDNFTGQQVYTSPMAWLRKEPADSLKSIQEKLNKEGLGLKVFDAYRPYAATLLFYEIYLDTTFVASPRRGSIHNRGSAVDVSIIDLATGEEIAMPTEFDHFSEAAFHSYDNLPEEAINNRAKLLALMEAAGFSPYKYEWWHYNFREARRFPLMNIEFEELVKEIQK